MIFRIIALLCCLSFSLLASAQASGGQIRRNKQNTTVKNRQSKPRKQSEPQVITSLPQIETDNAANLKKYNIQIAAFLEIRNVQSMRDDLRNQGYDARVYYDAPKRLYRVILAGFNDLQSAKNYKSQYLDGSDKFRSSYIFYIQDGETFFIQ